VTDLAVIFGALLPGWASVGDRVGSLRAVLLEQPPQPGPAPGARPDAGGSPATEPTAAERPVTHVAELARLSGLLVDTVARAAGTGHSLEAMAVLPAELPRAAAGLGALRGTAQRVGWIEHELARHHVDWAPDAPPPRVLLDVPVARLVAPNAACFPQPDGSSIVAVATAALADPAAMTRRGQAFLTLLAAHEGVPGHALQHWLVSNGPNAEIAPWAADPYATEGWAMAVEQAIGRRAGGGLRVAAAYHCLRRLLPTTVLAVRDRDGDQAARSWLGKLLSRCPEFSAEIAKPGRFESRNAQHYAIGLVRTLEAQPAAATMAAPLSAGLRARLAHGRHLDDRAPDRPVCG
jgi:hypothetical protein